jgi:CubicO group peptidase (beta-lactamase class C family)
MKLRYGDPEEAGMSARCVQHIAHLAQGWVERDITPTLVVLAARRGVIVLHEAYGRLTPAPDAPALPRDAIFPLASLSKPITATAAMLLVDEGLLGLNRPLAEYIPEFTGEGKNAVMVHHLLTHTSGLRDEDIAAHAMAKHSIAPPEDYRLPAWIYDHTVALCDTPLWKPPGTEMSYSDFNYDLLGEIVCRISGRPLADFARERIFEPLGMEDTSYILPDVLRHRVVRRPTDTPWADLDSPALQDSPWPAAGVLSTAFDIAIFGQMFLDEGSYGDTRVLSPAAVAEMTRNQIPGIGSHFIGQHFPEAGWGYGWSINGNKKSQLFGSLWSPSAFEHAGAGGVHMWIDPTYDLVGVYFSVALRNKSGTEILDWFDWGDDLFTNSVTAAVVQ